MAGAIYNKVPKSNFTKTGRYREVGCYTCGRRYHPYAVGSRWSRYRGEKRWFYFTCPNCQTLLDSGAEAPVHGDERQGVDTR